MLVRRLRQRVRHCAPSIRSIFNHRPKCLIPRSSRQILDVFDSDRQPDEAVRNPGRTAALGGDGRVRHRGGVAHERLDAAEALGEGEEAETVEDVPCLLEGRHLEGEHAAESSRHLRAGQCVLWMAGEAWIDDPRDARMRLEVPRNRQPIRWNAAPSSRPSVFVPRSTSHESNGLRIAPAEFCTNPSHSMSSSRVATTAPPTESLWPFRYFVVLCMTRSTPDSSGRCRKGLAKVLSAATITPPLVSHRRRGPAGRSGATTGSSASPRRAGASVVERRARSPRGPTCPRR